MKIKNIREYRTFYKNEIRDLANRDEHFMGTFYQDGNLKKTYGWFEIYHGDKEGYGKAEEGIGNFLSSFLDMAKDGQAVYEFLQNAVDAGASHFTMAWRKDEVDGNNYVLIANNGEMFNFDSIRSILNVGSSTKTADSQNIGKFGIGFKLAHRLVGKDNGLEELLSSQPSGPILFSWKNGDLEQLASGAHPEPQTIKFDPSGKGQYTISDTNPWLFKILITCFPALPANRHQSDDIRLSDGAKALAPVFHQDEYLALTRWVNNYRDYLNDDLYKQGALFFIKLGSGKENDLADKNLAEGVRFSLAILQETAEEDIRQKHMLQTVQLNRDAPIKKPKLNYLFFQITKKDHLNDYIFVRFGVHEESKLNRDQKAKLARESDIEVLFGFRNYDETEDYFKGAPNFYLYFPLSEEVHNFNFVLHSNAFYKASSRTFLHKGTVGEDGINERLLRTIAKRLEIELTKLYDSGKSSDKQKFLNLYAALLTSKESANYERQWVKKPFINEITAVLKKMVPARDDFNSNEFVLSHLHPFIKATAIDIPPQILNATNVQWFYWGPNSPDIIRYGAIEKLNLRIYDVFQMLMRQDIYTYVNEWIEKDRARIKTILNELNNFSPEKAKSENFKSNLKNLKLFEFADGNLFSDNELIDKQDEGYIILHNKLKEIEPKLSKMGITTSLLDFDDYEFYRHYTPYLSPDSQLRSQPKLIELISKAEPEKLNSDEKLSVFLLFRDMIEEGKKGERLNELRLFKNQKGQFVKIKNILQSTNILWLQPYTIHVDEQSKDLDRYLLNDEDLIFERIIYHFWEEIANNLVAKSPEAREQIFTQIRKFYNLSEYHKDSEFQLTEKEGLFFNGSYQEVKNPYYHENLHELDQETYDILQEVLNSEFDCQVPDFEYLTIYQEEPFILDTKENILDKDDYSFTFDQLNAFLTFCKICDIDVLEIYTLYSPETRNFKLISDSTDNYYSSNSLLIDYIGKYYHTTLIRLPSDLTQFSGLTPYSGTELTSKLIEEIDVDNSEQLLDLMEAMLQEDEYNLAQLFNAVQHLKLDLIWENDRNNRVVLKAVKRLSAGDKMSIDDIQGKLVFTDNGNEIALTDIDSANDDVIVNTKSDKIKLSRALILGLEDDGAIRKILDFAKEAVDRELLSQKEAGQIFKIQSDSVTPELVSNFKNSLEDGNLVNAHQLAFVLLQDDIDRSSLSQYKVLDAGGVWRKLEGNWILPDILQIEYYNLAYVFSDQYAVLNSFINLGNNDVFYYGNNDSDTKSESEDYILPMFLFRKGCTPLVLNQESDKLEIIAYILEQWKLTPKEYRNQILMDEWEDILKFKPGQKIYSLNILPEEKLDDEIIDWVKETEEERVQILDAIGIHTNESNIVRFRSWLLANEDDTNPPVMINQIPIGLLSNTLVGLAEGFVHQHNNVILFERTSRKHKLIVEIIGRLIDTEGDHEIRIPVWNREGKLCIGSENEERPMYLGDEDYEVFFPNNRECINDTLLDSVQVIFPDDTYKEFISEYYDKLKIEYDFIEPVDSVEHDEPFYKSWNKRHGIKLLRTSSLEYQAELICETEDDNIDLGIVTFGDYSLKRDADEQNIFYRPEISLEVLKSALGDSEDSDIAELLQELIIERNKMLAAFYNALTSSGKDDFDNEDSKRLLDSLKERSIEEKRNEIIEEIRSNQKYSYAWFVSYIQYLLSFEELADTTSQKSISFQQIEIYSLDGKPSEKYFMLKGANSVIPLNIEAFEDFSINIVFREGLKENIIVEGVSKKGQDLLTFIPRGIEKKIKNNFQQAVNIKINFSPVLDLIKRLYAAFTNENIVTPWDNIEETLPPVHFIYGPPGTGKTTKLCDTLEDEYQKNPVFKALILVPTNKAGDVLAKKLKINRAELSIVRIGSATDPELEYLDDEIYQSSLDDLTFGSINVIITTIHRFPYYQITQDHGEHYKLFDPNIDWDMVIFDESSMISLPYIVFALISLKANNPETKFLIAGDPKQIPPIVDTTDKNLENFDLDDESIYKMLNIRSFKKEEQEIIKREIDIIENLTIQYRSIEPIGKLFGSFSYDNLLQHGRDLKRNPKKQLPKNFFNELTKPVSLLNIPLDNDTSVLQPRKLLYSSYHVYAGIFTTEIIKHLDNCNSDNTNYTVGIISPYKAQAMLMNKLIISSEISKSIQVQCDTVHGFQGDECDIVIFVVNPNNMYYTGHKNALLSKEYVYNVAVSRARDYLWILNPFKEITNNPHILNIRNILGKDVPVILSSSIENSLFSQDDFIVKNSYLTGHDNINVFGQVDMKYFIKAGSTAIDIQLRK